MSKDVSTPSNWVLGDAYSPRFGTPLAAARGKAMDDSRLTALLRP
jgi:hypothetical protein